MDSKRAKERTLEKLGVLLEDDADFVMTRWVFDWDSNCSPIDNSSRARLEQKALIYLKNHGCIELRIEENPLVFLTKSMQESPTFAGYTSVDKTNPLAGFKRFRSTRDYKLSDTDYISPESDKAWSSFNWAVWITKFDKDKFTEICEKLAISAGNTKVKCNLEVANGGVFAIVGDTRYKLQQLGSGSRTEAIIGYCEQHFGQSVTLRELKTIPLLASTVRLTSVFEKNKLFKRNGLLKDFIELNVRDIMLKQQANITHEQRKKITESAKHSESIS